MNFTKITTNGQVTIPKAFRDRFQTEFYICELDEGAVVFRPIEIKKDEKKQKYTMKDFKNFSFKGKDPQEKHLSDKVDSITYGS